VRTEFLAFMPRLFHVSPSRKVACIVHQRRAAAPEAEARAAAIEDAAAVAEHDRIRASGAMMFRAGRRVYFSRAKTMRQTVSFADEDADEMGYTYV
jgi:hypothetical protein